MRRALGRELLEALEPGEEVRHVTPTATWASARALLVVTDRRLLWLLDDVVTARVQWLRLSRIASIRSQLRRPRRRVAILRVESDDGRKLAFSELRPPTAEAIVRAGASALRWAVAEVQHAGREGLRAQELERDASARRAGKAARGPRRPRSGARAG